MLLILGESRLMEIVGNIFVFVVFIAVVAVGFFLSKRSGAMAAAMGQQMSGGAQAVDEANRALFDATGYEHAAIQGQPMDAQLAYSRTQANDPMKGVHFVRNKEGLPVHFRTSVKRAGASVAYETRWYAECGPTFGLHLIDKSLLGAEGKARAKAFGIIREIEQAYPQEVTLDAQRAQRFRLFSTDPARAQAWIASPDAASALSQLSSVDLLVSPQGISLNDPMMDNLRPPGSDGGAAAMLSQTPAQRNAHTIAVHQAAANLLLSVARATT